MATKTTIEGSHHDCFPPDFPLYVGSWNIVGVGISKEGWVVPGRIANWRHPASGSL